MGVKVEFNGVIYTLIYNKQSGYYEIELQAPEKGGIYELDVNYTDILGEIYNEVSRLQVLTKIKDKVITDKVIAYFLDFFTFEIKDVVELQDYELNIDEETNAKSTITVMQKPNAGDRDFIFINENDEITYMGIIESPINESFESKYVITSKYITNLFDRKILINNESLISTIGIEDFIKYTIENEFTNSSDSLLNIKYLDVEVLTHTKIQKSIDNENGIYNFHTYMTNCSQNYNIAYIFKVVNGRLKITIEKQEQDIVLIDATLSDITNYTEVFETKVTAKVTVKTGTNKFDYFLLSDRTTTTDKTNSNRVIGEIEAVYTEKDEDSHQTAIDVFKGNRYEHLIQFDVNSDSKVFIVKKWYIGTPAQIKTKNNVLLDTYISAISKIKGGKFWNVKTGNIRIDFIDKLLKERNG